MGNGNMKRQKILETAQVLFNRQGIQQTSLEQIAEQVPVSKMTIYNHFGSKEGLLEQVLHFMMDKQMAYFHAIVDTSDNVLEVLRTLSQYEDYIDLSKEFLVELMEQYPHLSQTILQDQQDRFLSEFEDIIYQGQKSGYIRKDIAPYVLIMMIAAIKSHLSDSSKIAGISDLKQFSEQMLTIIYYGIVAPKDK